MKGVDFDYIVHLSQDFEVRPGLKLHVFLSDAPDIKKSSDLSGGLDIVIIKAFKDSQRYPDRIGTDLNKYKSVVVFHATFRTIIIDEP